MEMKNKLKILIVDDETYERILIEKCVDWEAMGFQIAGSVSSAGEALEVFEQEQPDMVFTDINMPLMDGLELSRKIREKNRDVKIVIITGYRDFEYARTAIKIGVEDFLLKPIASEELEKTAEKVKQDLLNEREKQKQLEESWPILSQDLTKRICMKQIGQEEAALKLRAYELPLLYEQEMTGILVEVMEKEWEKIDQMPAAVSRILGREHFLYSIFPKNRFFILVDAQAGTDCAQVLFENIRTILSEPVSMTVSGVHQGFEGCSEAFSECQESMFNTMKGTGSQLICYKDYMELVHYVEKTYPVSFEKFRLAVRSADFEAAVSFVDEYLERYIYQGPILVSQLRNVGVLLLHNTAIVLKDLGMSFDDVDRIGIYQKISDIGSVQAFCREFYEFLEIITKTVAEFSQVNSMSQKALQYIEDHLSVNGLSLHMVASGLYVSNSYLSRVFKQFSGESITKYIMRKRIEKSMELFDTTDLKVYEVAEKVGMPDAHYFGTCFKKYTGKTVNEYKSKKHTLLGKKCE